MRKTQRNVNSFYMPVNSTVFLETIFCYENLFRKYHCLLEFIMKSLKIGIFVGLLASFSVAGAEQCSSAWMVQLAQLKDVSIKLNVNCDPENGEIDPKCVSNGKSRCMTTTLMDMEITDGHGKKESSNKNKYPCLPKASVKVVGPYEDAKKEAISRINSTFGSENVVGHEIKIDLIKHTNDLVSELRLRQRWEHKCYYKVTATVKHKSYGEYCPIKYVAPMVTTELRVGANGPESKIDVYDNLQTPRSSAEMLEDLSKNNIDPNGNIHNAVSVIKCMSCDSENDIVEQLNCIVQNVQSLKTQYGVSSAVEIVGMTPDALNVLGGIAQDIIDTAETVKTKIPKITDRAYSKVVSELIKAQEE